MNAPEAAAIRTVHPGPMAEKRDVEYFLSDPLGYFGHSLTSMMSIAPKALQELQLAALKQRFAQFRHSLAMLERLADSQDINRIASLDDVLPLLFTHATYKSYPASLLDKQRFDQLTKWLAKLTTVDLSKVDVSACRTVDDWLMTLRRATRLTVAHTSGTSGTMSFLPWSEPEWQRTAEHLVIANFQKFGEPAAPYTVPLNLPCIYPFFRHGCMAHTLINDGFVNIVAGSEENFHAAYPGRVSADMLLLAARRCRAIARGQLDQLKISPELDARREEFEAQQREMPQRVGAFFDTIRTTLAGRQVFMMATSNLLFNMAENGLKSGIRKVFDASSVICTGGGGKGMVLPDNWQEVVKEFLGVDRLHMGYGMTEMSSTFPMCEHGHYHATPWVIPFLLDIDTGAALPRTGTVTGRFAFYDLLASQRWGGFVTGDEVTISWDKPCPCGRTAPYLDGRIQRVSEKKNDAGEEKITCAATAGAYDEALDFLNDGI
jgi:acyl-CoA synthetase (AMP-forming)/AMP-acid ligase II